MGGTESRPAGAGGPAPLPAQAKSVKLELDLERGRMGKLIGVGGQTIQKIQQRVPGVVLRTPTKDETNNGDYKFVAVTLQGRSDQAFQAGFLINDVAPVCLAVLSAQVQMRDTPLLLGRQRIVNLQKEIAVDTLRLPKRHDKQPKVVIEGYLEDVVRASFPGEGAGQARGDGRRRHRAARDAARAGAHGAARAQVKAYAVISGEFEKAMHEAVAERESAKLKAISRARMGGEGEDGDGDADGDGPDKGGKGARGPGGKRAGAAEPSREVAVHEVQLSEALSGLLQKGRTLSNLEKDSRAKVSVTQGGAVLRIEGTEGNIKRAQAIVDRLAKNSTKSGQAAPPAAEP